MTEEMDMEIDSLTKTSRGGVIIIAKEMHSGKMYRLHFSKSDFDWIAGTGK